MEFDELIELLSGDSEKPDTIYDDIRNSYVDVQKQLSDATESSAALAAQLVEKDGKIQSLEAEIARLQASNDDLFSRVPSDNEGPEEDEISGIDDLFNDDSEDE